MEIEWDDVELSFYQGNDSFYFILKEDEILLMTADYIVTSYSELNLDDYKELRARLEK